MSGEEVHVVVCLLCACRSWQKRNWIADWWRDYIYLKQRSPIPRELCVCVCVCVCVWRGEGGGG